MVFLTMSLGSKVESLQISPKSGRSWVCCWESYYVEFYSLEPRCGSQGPSHLVFLLPVWGTQVREVLIPERIREV